MNIQNENVNTKLLYSVGYVPEVDKYILSCVVTWVAWYNRYYEITKEEYEAFGTERLDQLASRFRELECKSDRFLFSDRDEENTTEQNALRTGMKQKEIFYNVHKLLDKAQIPVSYQIESFKRMIGNSKFDMELKIDIMEYRTRVFCYERGTLVFEKYVDDRTLLEYLILNEVVCSYFCVLGWFPIGFSSPIGVTSGNVTIRQKLHHLILPAFTLSLMSFSNIALHTRQKLIDVLNSEYVLFAKARGEGKWSILRNHGLRNILFPALTLQFASFAELFGGSVMAENVFSYPGLGSAVSAAGLQGDVPLLLGITLFSALFVCVGNMIADLLYGVIDPRTLEVDNEEAGQH